jgi:hypothetical protein
VPSKNGALLGQAFVDSQVYSNALNLEPTGHVTHLCIVEL